MVVRSGEEGNRGAFSVMKVRIAGQRAHSSFTVRKISHG